MFKKKKSTAVVIAGNNSYVGSLPFSFVTNRLVYRTLVIVIDISLILKGPQLFNRCCVLLWAELLPTNDIIIWPILPTRIYEIRSASSQRIARFCPINWPSDFFLHHDWLKISKLLFYGAKVLGYKRRDLVILSQLPWWSIPSDNLIGPQLKKVWKEPNLIF